MSNLSKSLTVVLFKEQQERFAHGRFFEKREESQLLTVAQLSDERKEWLALGHKKIENQWKTVKNIPKLRIFLKPIARLLRWFALITIESQMLLFLKEIKSNLLMVALF